MGEKYTLAVLGCGTMGTAILSGVLDARASENALGPVSSVGSLDELEPEKADLPTHYIATVNRKESKRRVERHLEHTEFRDSVEVLVQKNVEAASRADVVMLACKPQMVREFLQEDGMAAAIEGKVLVSICAGVRIAQIRELVPESVRVVRAMPNTPSKIREGMTVVSRLPEEEVDNRHKVAAIFSAVGRCSFLDEKHFDACTALAGSGPAFVLMFLEAMADGGVMMGLPRAEAIELAAQTMQGASRMVMQSGMHPAALKDSVTTPGGCTIAGLLQLEDGRLRSTVARAIQEATEHASGLGSDKKK